MEKTFREKVLKARQATLLTTATSRMDLSLSYIYAEVFNDLADLRALKVKPETFAEKIESILMDPRSIYQVETRFQRFKTTVYNESGYILEYSTVTDKKKNERGEISLLILAERNRLAQLVELFEEKVEEEKKINLLVMTLNGWDVHPLPVKKQPIDLGHYNKDLPHEEIKKELESEGSGLMIFHGAPGTGKTSYLRGLLHESHREFIWLDPKILSNMDSDSLLQIFAEYKNSVVVLEDCEKLVQSRERRGGQSSSEMNILLNLTDGILGDSFNLKFICTFNSGLDSIDTALLRNGRLKVKYEFKELEASRVKALSEKIGKNVPEMDMALCDIYNWDESKPVEKKPRAIGFAAY